MPERTEYAHGTPSWVDLGTTDVDAAQAFYNALFGWEYEARATGGGPDYILAKRHGKNAAGLMQQAPQQTEMGIPPVWTTYINVDSVDATLAKVAAAGGQVMMPAMDVMTEGRMAILVDPTGAVLGLWQKGDHVGAQVMTEHGALCWNEEQTPDVAAAVSFNKSVFGWGTEAMDMGDQGEYTVFTVGEEGVCGAMKPPMEGTPAHWSTVFAVDDADVAAATAGANGGSVLVEPFDMPVGRGAVLADGQGAVFQVIRMNEDG